MVAVICENYAKFSEILRKVCCHEFEKRRMQPDTI